MDSFYGASKPRLDARLQGFVPNGQSEPMCIVPANTTKEFSFNFPFGCDFNGIKMVCYEANSGDYVNQLETRYSVDGGITWKRYKKFGKNWPVAEGMAEQILLFPTKPQTGIMLAVTATATGAKDLKFSLGLFTFVDRQTVNPMLLEEGEDW